jgi:hypothetical protein
LPVNPQATGERARKELLCDWCSKYWVFEDLGKSELEEVAAELSIIPFKKNGPVGASIHADTRKTCTLTRTSQKQKRKHRYEFMDRGTKTSETPVPH